MILSYKLIGSDYHNKKVAFKSLMKTYGLTWRGKFSPTNPIYEWGNHEEQVTATFIKSNGITLSATLTWESDKYTEFAKKFQHWCEQFDSEQLECDVIENDGVMKELEIFMMVHKPNVERMRERGAPESLIELTVKDYERKLADKRTELGLDGSEER